MALVKLSQLLQNARAGGYAVGYFEAWDMYSMEAVVEAAEAEQAPVMIGFGGMMMDQDWIGRFGIEPMGAYGRAIAERAKVPVAFILNEVWELDHALRGIGQGFNTLMLNACDLPYQENFDLTKKLVAAAHPHGIEVQAELGRLPNFGEDDICRPTDPNEAKAFVEGTGVDFLAVSIGNMHLRTEGKATVDLDRFRAIRAKVDVPLVIHGGSGFPDEVVHEVIDAGVALFHVGSVMKKEFFHCAKKVLNEQPEPYNYQALTGSRKATDFLLAGKQSIVDSVRASMKLYKSSGKAA